MNRTVATHANRQSSGPPPEGHDGFVADYRSHLADLEAAHRGGLSGLDLVRRHSGAMDRWLMRFLSTLPREALSDSAVIALGSYGRKELSPWSDLDLLFLRGNGESRWTEEMVRSVLYFLWDVGLEVGYAVRNVEECVIVAGEDNRARTALLDHRLIAGDSTLLGAYRQALQHRIFTDAAGFIRMKLKDMEDGRKKFGDSVYMLEPHIKEGAGGLRDLNVLEWAAKVYRPFRGLSDQEGDTVTPEEAGRLRKAQDFMLRVRNDLHFALGRKNDRLTFDQQERIAKAFAYPDDGRWQAVETFMKDYYLNAAEIQHLADRLLHRILDRLSPPAVKTATSVGRHWIITGGRLRAISPDELRAEPDALIETFKWAAEKNVDVDPATLAECQKQLDAVATHCRSSAEAWSHFFAVLRAPEGTSRVLHQMNESGVLGKMIPEFGALRCQAQHDAYHIYTTDVHTIRVVREWKLLRGGKYYRDFPMLTRLAKGLPDDLVLVLGLLFHDIGKGTGKGHSRRGAEMVGPMGRQMGLQDSDIDTIRFLVEQHLLLSNAAYRRDTDDPDLVRQVADLVQTEERLTLLYLLTFSDTRAVGPTTWNQWKGNLLQELFIKVGEIINPRDFRDERQRMNERMDEIVRRVSEKIPEAEARKELAALPSSYVLANPPWKVARHLQILTDVRTEKFVATLRRPWKRPMIELLVCTMDSPGLLARHAGTLTSYGLNILKVQVNTTADGRVLDLYHVEDPVGRFYEELDRWESLKEDLRKASAGELDVRGAVERSLRTAAGTQRYLPRVHAQVLVDNDISLRHTVLEIQAQDRLGLLFALATRLSELGMTIMLAKINTEGEKAIDVFYVQDLAGEKIRDEARLSHIRDELLKVAGSKT